MFMIPIATGKGVNEVAGLIFSNVRDTDGSLKLPSRYSKHTHPKAVLTVWLATNGGSCRTQTVSCSKRGMRLSDKEKPIL